MFISLANVFLDQIKCMHFHAFAFGNLSRKVGFGKIKVTIYKTEQTLPKVKQAKIRSYLQITPISFGISKAKSRLNAKQISKL